MSARKPAEIIQDIYAAFGRRDIPSIVAAMSDNVTWTVHGPQTIPYAGKRAGKAAVLGWFDTLGKTITITQFDIDQLIAQADMVTAIGSFTCTVNATSKPYATKFAHVWRVPNGAVASFEDFFDTAGAAAAHSR